MVAGRLPLFLWCAAEKRFQWGQWDCGLWLADWLMFGTGKPDPASDLRGKYHDAESCLALCGPLGFPRMIQRIADNAGLERTRSPQRGDVAVIRTRPGNVAVGAICLGKSWAYIGQRGGVSSVSDVRVLSAWRI